MILSALFFLIGFAVSCMGDCPNGATYNAADGKCYYAFNGTLPWASALNMCYSMGGNLAIPKNAFENAIFMSVVQDTNKLGSWLGAYSSDSGIWYDYLGNVLTFTRWGPMQPFFNGSCASIGADGYWFADRCEVPEDFICQVTPGAPVTTRSIPKTTTTSTKATPPTTYPSYPTVDPNPVLCPGYDYMNGTNPCASGWHFYLPTCSCYLMSTHTLSWLEAENNCINYKAHLASVHSQGEAVFIEGLTTETKRMIQIGLQYFGKQWVWSDSSPVTFLNFAPRVSRPDLITNPCGAIFSDGFYFATYMGNGPCNVRYSHSVCKRPLTA